MTKLTPLRATDVLMVRDGKSDVLRWEAALRLCDAFEAQAKRIHELEAEAGVRRELYIIQCEQRLTRAEAELASYTGASVSFGGRGPIKCHKLIADAFNMLRDTLNEKVEPELGPHPLRARAEAAEAEVEHLLAVNDALRARVEKLRASLVESQSFIGGD